MRWEVEDLAGEDLGRVCEVVGVGVGEGLPAADDVETLGDRGKSVAGAHGVGGVADGRGGRVSASAVSCVSRAGAVVVGVLLVRVTGGNLPTISARGVAWVATVGRPVEVMLVVVLVVMAG